MKFVFKKSFVILFVLFLCATVLAHVVFNRGKNIRVENVSIVNCVGHTPASFSCFARHYRDVASTQGTKAAISELKTQTGTDAYTKKECHLLMHEIGRSVASRAPSIGEAFENGDQFCAGGYYHGVMEGFIQKQGKPNFSAEFLNGICGSFKPLSVGHQDCAHGLGHGIMYMNNNELFDALKTCDLLTEHHTRSFCWTGVFMENVITDFRDHTTTYLKTENPMYPCDSVSDMQQQACYAYQSMQFLKVTGSFEKTFALCREIPNEYQSACFESIGRDATAGLVQENIGQTKENCLLGADVYEQESCVIGAVRYMIANHQSDTDGLDFCAVLPSNLQAVCVDTADRYFSFISQI